MDASSVLAHKAARLLEETCGSGQKLEDLAAKLGCTGRHLRRVFRDTLSALMQGEIILDQSADPEREMPKLRGIKGIGSWTAQYIAMRTMGWPDAFLETDPGIKHALPEYTPKEMLALAEQWRPWRSYAVINLWNA